MALAIPQAELPVMATGEEAVLGRMCTQPPELVGVALQQNLVTTALLQIPSLLPLTFGFQTWITGEKP